MWQKYDFFFIFVLFICQIIKKRLLIVYYCKAGVAKMQSVFIFCGVFNAGLAQGLFSFHACAAFAALLLTALVAAPCLAVVNAEASANACYVGLADAGVGGTDFYALPCAEACGVIHCFYKLRTAVRIDGMVAGMIGDEHL